MNQITTTNGFSPLEVEAMQKLNDYLKTFIEVKNEVKIIHKDKQEVLTQLYAIVIKTIELSGENKKYNLDNQTIKNVAGFIAIFDILYILTYIYIYLKYQFFQFIVS
jgi:hypothetical protein